MNTDVLGPGGDDDPRLPIALLVAAVAAAAAVSEAWASGVGTAVAVYAVLTASSRDRRS
ncbi:hypothetical protein AB0M05_40785 [Streptomyces violaceusniger]|uniref:hypothetical protein n=1 Tax=Streptomyces violaceusniger TaxID=68280 RepID=UPI003436549B